MRFTLPRDVYHGKGALEALKSFKGKKAMIVVGGGSMKRFGFLQKAEAYLKEAGMEVELFENVDVTFRRMTFFMSDKRIHIAGAEIIFRGNGVFFHNIANTFSIVGFSREGKFFRRNIVSERNDINTFSVLRNAEIATI